MHESRFSNRADPAVGSSRSEFMAVASPPTDDDADLLTLEVQFNSLVAELLAAQKASGELAAYPDQHSLVQESVQVVNAGTDHEARTRQVEAILARLCPAFPHTTQICDIITRGPLSWPDVVAQ
jgi:hypothetical protein